MTFVVTFDLYSVLLMIVLPAVIVFVCYIALMIGQRVQTFWVGNYVRETVERNNRLIEANRELRKRLGEEMND